MQFSLGYKTFLSRVGELGVLIGFRFTLKNWAVVIFRYNKTNTNKIANTTTNTITNAVGLQLVVMFRHIHCYNFINKYNLGCSNFQIQEANV